MKHNRTCVTLQETLNEIKLIGEEIEISQIDRTTSTHGDTNALSINTLTNLACKHAVWDGRRLRRNGYRKGRTKKNYKSTKTDNKTYK